jgi:hypothetical protein
LRVTILTKLFEQVSNKILREQVPDSRLKEFVILSNPDWLTGAIPSGRDNTQVILVRSAVAF